MIDGTAVKRAAASITVVLLIVAVAVAWQFLPTKRWLLPLDAWFGRLGAWGVVVFAIAYVGLVILLAPAEIMSIAAGLIFGLWGLPLVIASATTGATLAFLISRYLVRAKVREFAEKRQLFRAADTLIKEEGWKVVALLRLNPLVPFNIQNYFFGATDISLLAYAVATFFGIMPGAVAYVYLGTLGHVAAEGKAPGALNLALLAVGLVATALLIFVVMRKANAALKHRGLC